MNICTRNKENTRSNYLVNHTRSLGPYPTTNLKNRHGLVLKVVVYLEAFESNITSNMGLTHYQTTNFRLFQTERVCRRQFEI